MAPREILPLINANAVHAAAKTGSAKNGVKKFRCNSHQSESWIDCHILDSDLMSEDLPSALVSCSDTGADPATSVSRKPVEVCNVAKQSSTTHTLALDAFIDEVISEWSEDSKSEQNHELSEQTVSPLSLRQNLFPGGQARLGLLGSKENLWENLRRPNSMKDSAGRERSKDKQHEKDFFALSDWLGRTQRVRGADSVEKSYSTGAWVLQVLGLSVMLISFVCLVLATAFVYPNLSRG
ncbi:hypothetical protein EDB81DRAFT_891279 [Dactylonectria macrodidyma]|uniref:Uncharacterized protein n=1 Tax=Dactylonectria macrodidyma TaxID=307937 RepID=A0A9P9DK94_9HYPO|nr:hypothetical protein EDB81DRAFT_891279 [Dactylonectria macrodidyma]